MSVPSTAACSSAVFVPTSIAGAILCELALAAEDDAGSDATNAAGCDATQAARRCSLDGGAAAVGCAANHEVRRSSLDVVVASRSCPTARPVLPAWLCACSSAVKPLWSVACLSAPASIIKRAQESFPRLHAR